MIRRLEISWHRRSWKTFTAVLNIVARAVSWMSANISWVSHSININNVLSVFIDICKMLNVDFLINKKDLIMDINKVKISFTTKMVNKIKKNETVVLEKQDTVTITDY